MSYFLIIIALGIIFGPNLWARSVLNRYNRDEYFSGSGMELARLLLDRMNMTGVAVNETPIGDHYDPVGKAVCLTRERCGRRTLTAVVVAAHEVGHAVQDELNFKPLALRTRLVQTAATVERVGAGMMLAVPVLTLITRVPAAGILMLVAGLGTLSIPVVVHLLTLPTELDASFNRALPMLSSGNYIPKEDIPAAKKILFACALTYVGGALVSLLNVWRWFRVLKP